MSTLQRLRNAARLSAPERGLTVRAVLMLAAVRAALALRPFPVVRRWTDRWAGDAPLQDRAAMARAVERAMHRAARLMPGARCLPQALAAELLLRRAGCTARTTIGVASDGAPLDAHAWVESAGVLVTGGVRDLARYRTLVVFGADRPSESYS